MLNLMDIIKEQQTTGSNTRNTNWVEFSSKKQLQSNCTILTSEVINTLCTLKNTFTFNVHKSGTFVVITMYFSTSKSYSFYVVNTVTLSTQIMDSVKEAKNYVQQQMLLLSENEINTVETAPVVE